VDGPAVFINNLLDDGKSDPGSHFTRLLGLFGAIELFEDSRDLFAVHADALIRDGKLKSTLSVILSKYGNPRLGRRVFDCVRQQIIDRVFH